MSSQFRTIPCSIGWVTFRNDRCSAAEAAAGQIAEDTAAVMKAERRRWRRSRDGGWHEKEGGGAWSARSFRSVRPRGSLDTPYQRDLMLWIPVLGQGSPGDRKKVLTLVSDHDVLDV